MNKISCLQALFGGTFDPVHYGHLKPVEILADLIGLHHVIIMPNNIPPHRPLPEANKEHRKKMLELAIEDNTFFNLDERELYRNTPSYTAQTIQEWRNEWGSNQPLAFIIGQDSLLTMPSWHWYETILNNIHLVVCRRPGYPLKMKNIEHQKWLEKHLTYDINDLHGLSGNKIYLAKTPWFDISSTLIRQRLQMGLSCEDMLPPRVLEYILQKKLYKKVFNNSMIEAI